jgi:hypothetical protein
VLETLPTSGKGVLKDELIRLSSPKAKKDCPSTLRHIRFLHEEDSKTNKVRLCEQSEPQSEPFVGQARPACVAIT